MYDSEHGNGAVIPFTPLRISVPALPNPFAWRLPRLGRPRKRSHFASTSLSIGDGTMLASATMTSGSGGSGGGGAMSSCTPSVSPSTTPMISKVPLRPTTDVLAGALARAASQSTIHPLDTLKVRLQTRKPPSISLGLGNGVAIAAPTPAGLSKIGQLVPPFRGPPPLDPRAMGRTVASLYRGVLGAASGAGIAIGAYFAVYGAACNCISAARPDMSPSAVAFVSGGVAAAGSSFVKVPLAVCIRSVQAGVYPNVFTAARTIVGATGVRGLFTGFAPTVLEDVPDMAIKFAVYEALRQVHRNLIGGRAASVQEDFAMGAASGALAAAATTPLDVIKTNMMCAAASRPTMASAAAQVYAANGAGGFMRGVGTRALSNGINSAVFFVFFEAIRGSIKAREAEKLALTAAMTPLHLAADGGSLPVAGGAAQLSMVSGGRKA